MPRRDYPDEDEPDRDWKVMQDPITSSSTQEWEESRNKDDSSSSDNCLPALLAILVPGITMAVTTVVMAALLI